jgi:hypothetical protein
LASGAGRALLAIRVLRASGAAAVCRFSWSMIFSENRCPPRIECGAGFFGIMLECERSGAAVFVNITKKLDRRALPSSMMIEKLSAPMRTSAR